MATGSQTTVSDRSRLVLEVRHPFCPPPRLREWGGGSGWVGGAPETGGRGGVGDSTLLGPSKGYVEVKAFTLNLDFGPPGTPLGDQPPPKGTRLCGAWPFFRELIYARGPTFIPGKLTFPPGV